MKGKRVLIKEAGGYEVLDIVAFQCSAPKANEVIIKTKAVGINYADICVRWGVYESAKKYVGWPICPGFEFSGEIVALGESVSDFEIGDKVFGVNRFDSYASHVCVDALQVFKLPSSLSLEQAAGIPAVFLTAYHALFQHVVVHLQSTILVHSAAGGVGSSLVQLAKNKGHRVIGVVGNPIKKDYVLELGAELVFSKQEVNWKEEVQKAFPKGIDVVLDANGYSTLQDSFDLLAPMGKLISYGFHSMLPKKGGKINWLKAAWAYIKTPRFNPMDMTAKNKSLITFNLSFLFDEQALFREAMLEIINLLESNSIKPPKVTTYAFDNVAQAHRDLESGNTQGKLILILEE